jgi:CspA family cold shock protein
MSYRDTWITCESCEKRFVFTVEEQRRLDEAGFDVEAPSLCPDCRESEGPEPGEGPYEGVVKWFSSEKGYGFIVQRTGDEVFFHRSGIADGAPEDFEEGARVTYVLEETPKGPAAVEVALLE